jgi:hypothetical protein
MSLPASHNFFYHFTIILFILKTFLVAYNQQLSYSPKAFTNVREILHFLQVDRFPGFAGNSFWKSRRQPLAVYQEFRENLRIVTNTIGRKG